MSLYIVFQDLATGKLALDERLTVSGYAAAMPPSRLGLVKGLLIRIGDMHRQPQMTGALAGMAGLTIGVAIRLQIRREPGQRTAAHGDE